MNNMVTMKDVVQEEINRQQARRRAATERARTVEASRDRLLARRLAALNKRLNRKPNLFQRLWRPVTDAWELMWAVLFFLPEMFINLCLEKGWLEEV